MTAHTNPADNQEPFFLAVTVTIKMTPAQLAEYELDYGIGAGAGRNDVREHLSEAVSDALGAVRTPLLRDYSTYTVSQPR